MSDCRLCGSPVLAGEDNLRIGAFAQNQRDPLRALSGGEFHRACFERHPLAAAARQRGQEWLKKTGPGRRFCALCGEVAGSGSAVLELPFLVADETHQLAPWNDALLHRDCIAGFAGRGRLLESLAELRASEAWEGGGLDDALAALAAST